MTDLLIQVCRRTMAFARTSPRPACEDAQTAVEIGAPRLGSSEIAWERDDTAQRTPSVESPENRPLRGFAPQHIDLLPENQYFRFKPSP
jgi:hypothetical protein